MISRRHHAHKGTRNEMKSEQRDAAEEAISEVDVLGLILRTPGVLTKKPGMEMKSEQRDAAEI